MELGFDAHALVHPKSREDFLALVQEARAELQRINQHLDDAFAECDAPVDP